MSLNVSGKIIISMNVIGNILFSTNIIGKFTFSSNVNICVIMLMVCLKVSKQTSTENL
jgi:hypothetical protein